MSRFTEKVGTEVPYRTEYQYDTDNRLTDAVYCEGAPESAGQGIHYTYDTLGRVSGIARGSAAYNTTSKKYAVTANAALGTSFTFVAGNGQNATTPLVESITQGSGTNAMNFAYTYDNVGNIVSETRNSATTSYAYDALGQLIRVNDPHENATWTYAYDCGGNILNKKKYAYTTGELGSVVQTIPYVYDTTWRDKLISYDGKAITYDVIGNPLTYDGWTYEWQAGRQLKRMYTSDKEVAFEYDAKGLRTRKTVTEGTKVTTTEYTLHGKLLTNQTVTTVENNGAPVVDAMHFYYDAQSRPAELKLNNNIYTYSHDLQGDIAGSTHE